MTSIRQITANRANALKSSGPRSPEGRRISAANSTKHGLFAKKLQVREEDRGVLQQFRAQIHAEFQPRGPTETFYVDHLIDQCWRLRCCLQIETDVFEFYRVYKEVKGDASIAFAHDASEGNCLTRLSRYAPLFERGLFQDLAELRKLQKRRSRPSAPSQRPGMLADSAIGQSQPRAHDAATLDPPLATTQPQPPAQTPRLTYFAPVGTLSEQALLSDEDPNQFQEYIQSLFAEWQPRRATKAFFVELFALTSWGLVRLSRVEAGLFAQYRFHENVDGGPLTAFAQDAAELDCFSKLAACETRLRNSLSKILKELLT